MLWPAVIATSVETHHRQGACMRMPIESQSMCVRMDVSGF